MAGVINGEFLDTVQMEWLEGQLLKDYLEQNLYNKATLQKLAQANKYYKGSRIARFSVESALKGTEEAVTFVVSENISLKNILFCLEI